MGAIIQKGIKYGSGNDGFSPIVSVTDTENGHKVDIKDARGTKTFEVLNGRNGIDAPCDGLIFTSLSELGLTAPVTVGDIFNAMPEKTTAIIACEGKEGNTEGVDIHVSDVPVSFGILTIKKNGTGRFSIDYQNSLGSSPCNVKKWIGTLKGNDGTGLIWKQLSAEPTYVTLADIGLTADATFQDAIDALPKGGSALLGVTEFTNYQTIFPYEEGNDQFGRVHIVKGTADGGRVYARWFRKDGVKEAIAIFNINDNKFGGWRMLKNQQSYNSLKELGLDTTATINDIISAMANNSVFTYKTDVFDYATEYNNIQYGTVTIYKQSEGRVQALMTDKNTGNLYVGRMDNTNKFVGWRGETFHRAVAQATAGYFKFKPTGDGGFDQPLRISVTDNYGGMINISGAKPSSSQYKPFKCIRLSYGEYSNYDAMKLANNKMLKLFYYDGYFYLKVATYTTCTFTGLTEAPTYIETFEEKDAEEIPIRSVFDTPYNDGYADPSIIAIGDTDSSDGLIKSLTTLGFTTDIMTWDTGVYRLSHVSGLTNLPAEITEEKPGFRLEHYDVKKWGSNHNPHKSTYGCRQSVLHYKGNIFVRYTESGATAGVITYDTGWQELAKVYTTLTELGLTADATIENVIKKLPVGGKAIISTHEFTNYQTLFPYSVEADQYATLKVEKGYDNAGSRTIVTWVRKDASRLAYGGLDANNTVKWWNEVSMNGIGAKTLVTNAQNFKLDITKKNANYYGFFKLEYLYGYHLCEICIGISSTIAYTVTKGKNLIDKITYTTNGANIVFGIDFTSKVYGIQVVEMPTDFGRINSLTAESFTGSTVVNQTGLDLELYKQTKVVTSLDKGTWQVGQRIKQKTDFTANTDDVCFEFVAKNESSSGVKTQKMTIYQLTPIENGTNASLSLSVFENGKAQVTVWPATENMPRNDYNIVSEGYLNSKFKYSTSEVAIGTWIDGKTIYRKAYKVTGEGTSYLTKTLETIKIDNLINVSGNMKCGTTSVYYQVPIPYIGVTSKIDYNGSTTSTSTDSAIVRWDSTESKLNVSCKSDSVILELNIIVEYTKK